MSELISERIFKGYKNGETDKTTALNHLKLIIENCPEEPLRVDSLKVISRIENNTDDIYAFLENLLVSDTNPSVRAGAAEVILNKYMDQGRGAIKWAINNENSSECLLKIYESLKEPNNKISRELLKIFKNNFYYYNRSFYI